MFRGGSTSNEGIMSVPRKGYGQGPDEGGVQGLDLSSYPYGTDENNEETTTTPVNLKNENLSVNISQMDKQASNIQEKNKMYNFLGQNVKKGSIGDIMVEEYLGNRPDPMGKFLINFGLNYMSARPRGGKFGAITTAADAAKKPTEQLYADVDTDRLLKLKLMGALSKSENAGAFEKKIDAIWKSEQNKVKDKRRFNSREEVVDTVLNTEQFTKGQTEETQVNVLAQKIMEKNEAPNMQIAKNKAYFDLFGAGKISKEESNALANKYYLPSNALTPKQNSTDFALTDAKNLETTIGKLKEGQTYVDAKRRQIFLYVGQNTFRPLSKF